MNGIGWRGVVIAAAVLATGTVVATALLWRAEVDEAEASLLGAAGTFVGIIAAGLGLLWQQRAAARAALHAGVYDRLAGQLTKAFDPVEQLTSFARFLSADLSLDAERSGGRARVALLADRFPEHQRRLSAAVTTAADALDALRIYSAIDDDVAWLRMPVFCAIDDMRRAGETVTSCMLAALTSSDGIGASLNPEPARHVSTAAAALVDRADQLRYFLEDALLVCQRALTADLMPRPVEFRTPSDPREIALDPRPPMRGQVDAWVASHRAVVHGHALMRRAAALPDHED